MRRTYRGVVCLAAVGIVLLTVLAAALFLQRSREQARAEERGRFRVAGAEPAAVEPAGEGQAAVEPSGAGQAGGGAVGEEPGAAGQKGEAAAAVGTGEAAAEEENTAEGETESPVKSSSDIVMLFAGDVYFSDHVLRAYDSAGGIHGVLDEGIRAEIEKADIFMVNQEFPFTVRGTAAEDKQFTFRVPESRIHILQEMGVDIVTLANNHILDFGAEGLLDSCKALDEAGILHVGGGADFDQASALETIIVGQKTIEIGRAHV